MTGNGPDRAPAALAPADLCRLSREDGRALLAYLNLPPVGALNDGRAVPRAGEADAYEIGEPLRRALRERREAAGGFSSLDQLLGVDGFGPGELAGIAGRLGDLDRYGHRARPVWGGPESEREFFALLESATRCIHVQTYIIGGRAGLRLAALLARKRREGVETRVLFCASGFVVSGSPSGTGFVSRFSELRSYLLADLYARRRILAAFREGGVEFVNSSPIGRHWRRRDLRAAGVRTARDYERWARARGIPDAWLEEQAAIDAECSVGWANVDHRKMVIVDGERAFVGSQNVADSYFYPNGLDPDPRVNFRNWQWHDNSTILEGGLVRGMNRLFARRWMLSGGAPFDPEDARYTPPPARAGDAVASMVTTIPGMVRVPWKENAGRFALSLLGADRRPISVGENPIRERLLALPGLAQRDLHVEHCYPSDSALLERWADAASRGAEVHMVVPLWYDTPVLGAECDRFFPELIAKGARLHGFDRAILHSKITVMDGFYVATGSYNLTLRSARADLENELFVQDASFGGAVRDRIRGDFAECVDVAPGTYARYRSRRSIPIFDAVVRFFII